MARILYPSSSLLLPLRRLLALIVLVLVAVVHGEQAQTPSSSLVDLSSLLGVSVRDFFDNDNDHGAFQRAPLKGTPSVEFREAVRSGQYGTSDTLKQYLRYNVSAFTFSSRKPLEYEKDLFGVRRGFVVGSDGGDERRRIPAGMALHENTWLPGSDYVTPETPDLLLADSNQVVFSRMSYRDPALSQLSTTLRTLWEAPNQVNLIHTPRSEDPDLQHFVHVQQQDLLWIQLDGTSKVDMYSPPATQEQNEDYIMNPGEPVVATYTLEPGDVLYVPRRFVQDWVVSPDSPKDVSVQLLVTIDLRDVEGMVYLHHSLMHIDPSPLFVTLNKAHTREIRNMQQRFLQNVLHCAIDFMAAEDEAATSARRVFLHSEQLKSSLDPNYGSADRNAGSKKTTTTTEATETEMDENFLLKGRTPDTALIASLRELAGQLKSHPRAHSKELLRLMKDPEQAVKCSTMTNDLFAWVGENFPTEEEDHGFQETLDYAYKIIERANWQKVISSLVSRFNDRTAKLAREVKFILKSHSGEPREATSSSTSPPTKKDEL